MHTEDIRPAEANTAAQGITRRAAVRALAGAAALAAAPAAAFAEDESTTEQAEEALDDEVVELDESVQEIDEGLESWRYEDGEVVFNPSTDSTASGLSLLASSDYPCSTWKKSYGTSYIGIMNSASSINTQAVSGVERVGIDVSRWNGEIDWDEVASDGIEFAILRCMGHVSKLSSVPSGYSYWASKSDSGYYYAEPYFQDNVAGALAAGIKFGIYVYSLATSTTGASQEASLALEQLADAGVGAEDLEMPVFLDMEDSSQKSLSASTLGDIAQTFCETFESAGYRVGIYASKSWWASYLTDSAFDNELWFKWVARYPASTTVAAKGTETDGTDIWQFTSHGTVSGISGNVDVNFDYLGADAYTGEALPFTVNWSSHIQKLGTKSGTASTTPLRLGTTGGSKRLEYFSLAISGTELSGSITYRAHCQTYGWQDWVSDGEIAGTSGLSKRVEAVQIELTDELAEAYDIYYRVHVQTYGWLDWACNGEVAGTTGLSKRVESLQIAFVEKDGDAPGDTTTPYVAKATLSARAHMQTYGWLDPVASGETVGLAGAGKRMEALEITMSSNVAGSISYRAHVQNIGWQDWVSDGETAGTSGLSKRVEAVQIKLTGEAASNYVVWYRAYAQGYGWLGWAKNGATAGTTGKSKRLEAVQVQILAKSASAPGSTSNAYIS